MGSVYTQEQVDHMYDLIVRNNDIFIMPNRDEVDYGVNLERGGRVSGDVIFIAGPFNNDRQAKAAFEGFCRDKLGLEAEHIVSLVEKDAINDIANDDYRAYREFNFSLSDPVIRGKIEQYASRLEAPGRHMDVDGREPGVGGLGRDDFGRQ